MTDCSLVGKRPMTSDRKFSCDQMVVKGKVRLVSGNHPVNAASSGTVSSSELPCKPPVLLCLVVVSSASLS